jgi:hypothetical protein
MNRHYEQRLRKLEQHKALQVKKRWWVPQWLSDLWREDYGLPFDTPERAIDSLQRMQKLDETVRPAGDDGAIQ